LTLAFPRLKKVPKPVIKARYVLIHPLALTYLKRKKTAKKESGHPVRAWEKCKGAAQAELCTTLAFLLRARLVGSPHIFAWLFFMVLIVLDEHKAG